MQSNAELIGKLATLPRDTQVNLLLVETGMELGRIVSESGKE